MNSVDVFHLGPQKAGTAWIYSAFQEHPEIYCMPQRDSVHYFDMNYHRGEEWYLNHFAARTSEKTTVDATYSYIRSVAAPRRIYDHNPGAKLIVCLRNPIDRAFSHYWHGKKKRDFEFSFEEGLRKYDLYSSWIETGFYADHIERYLNYFSREQLLVTWFEDLNNNTHKFASEIFSFMEVDSSYIPSHIESKVNVAGAKVIGGKKVHNLIRTARRKTPIPHRYLRPLRIGYEKLSNLYYSEHREGINEETRKVLRDIYAPEISRLEALLAVDLSEWK